MLKASLKIRVINEKLVEVTNISDITYQATGGKNSISSQPENHLLFRPGIRYGLHRGELPYRYRAKLTVTASDFDLKIEVGAFDLNVNLNHFSVNKTSKMFAGDQKALTLHPQK